MATSPPFVVVDLPEDVEYIVFGIFGLMSPRCWSSLNLQYKAATLIRDYFGRVRYHEEDIGWTKPQVLHATSLPCLIRIDSSPLNVALSITTVSTFLSLFEGTDVGAPLLVEHASFEDDSKVVLHST